MHMYMYGRCQATAFFSYSHSLQSLTKPPVEIWFTAYYFGYGACQTAFTKWISLRHCVLGDVEKWNKHSVADLCETVTLYLPVGLADHYLMCLANYHKLKLAHLDAPRCQCASYPCYKIAEKGQNFCRMHRNNDVL